ncbi:MAG: B12-binding domain-containing radical SAM protein [Nitrospirota bacterium]
MNIRRINLLLVNAKSAPDDTYIKERKFQLFPFSIGYLYNYIKKNDVCDVDFLDLELKPIDTLWHDVRTNKYDLIGFTSTTEARFDTIDKILMVKSMSPEVKIVVGGQFFSVTADDALRSVSEIDFIVRGEGEQTLSELVETLSEGKNDYSEINGLSYRIQDRIIHNPNRKPETNLDKYLIDYSLFANLGYDYLFPFRNFTTDDTMRSFILDLGRGCSNHCIFCTVNFHLYRPLKLTSVIAQINWVMNNLNTKYFTFADPSFTERPKFVTELCQYLIDNNYDIQWWCEVRADTPVELLTLMQRAGCISTQFAVESGSDKVLTILKKKLNLQQIESFAKACHNLGIRAVYNVMFSMPEETPEDCEKTLEVIKMLYKYEMEPVSVQPLVIYPGTELYDMSVRKGIIPENFSWFDRSYKCNYKYILPGKTHMPHYLDTEYLSESQVQYYLNKVIKDREEYYNKKYFGERSIIHSIKQFKRHMDKARTLNDVIQALKRTALFLTYKIRGLVDKGQ